MPESVLGIMGPGALDLISKSCQVFLNSVAIPMQTDWVESSVDPRNVLKSS